MTREDIIRMAREASNTPIDHHATPELFGVNQLERFAALVAAAERDRLESKFEQLETLMKIREGQPNKPCCLAEREACAKVCESRFMGDMTREDMEARRCAAAIRARGEML